MRTLNAISQATIDFVAPFFAIVRRDSAMLFLKGSGEAAPNGKRHAWARVSFSESLKDTPDRLRGFESIDPDGHVLFFGRPRT
jgi:hypothetical protein